MREIKTVYKPWGKEEWIELNDKYCYKRIYINAGHRTSYQYHKVKLETNYIISGEAVVWLENIDGIVEKMIMTKDDFFTVYPLRKHRVAALTDIVLQEVSTPEVDDVIRVRDDSNRKSGRLTYEHKNPALCIVAAGRGSRLGYFSKQIHKGLLPINNKAVISDIIDKTPNEYDIIIAVGYKAHFIKEYCIAAHSDRNIVFVDVKNYEGKGSGPGHSLLCCKKYLQRPFYLAVADCLVKGDLPLLDRNWLGVYPTSLPELYSTVRVKDNMDITAFKNKSKSGFNHAFIGICGILDFKTFWRELGNSKELVSAFYNVSAYKSICAKLFDWYDTGTIDNYIRAKSELDSVKYGISKNNGEFLYKVNNKFVKIFSNSKLARNKIKRAKILDGLVPDLIYKGKNTFSYKWVDGKTLYEVRDESVWSDFLDWCHLNLWKSDKSSIRKECMLFYKDKTLNRLESFLKKKDNSYLDSYKINGIRCDKIFNYVDKIDWNYICGGISTSLFHGDLQFDNVIYDGKTFYLIDWRDSFGRSVLKGDVYYDLSKMYGGLIMSYKLMKDPINYTFYKHLDDVTFNHTYDVMLKSFKEYFEEWAVVDHGYDLQKIKKITSLIYLNMAPLHSDGLDDLLFFKSISLMEDLYD
jgi:mannose-6-phosphate isomerase-like protein (cupin superfamily)/dTDP-glucose pyrophosphorylase